MKNFKADVFAALVLLTAMSVGCVKQQDSTPPTPPITPGEVFDFSTTKSYNLNLNYDVVEGYQVGFDVYTENPFTISAQGELIKNSTIKPIDKGFANDKGEYSSPITIPAYVKAIYIHTPDVGVNPRFFVAKVENGVLGQAQPALYTGEVAGATKSATKGITIDQNVKVGTAGMKFKKPHLLLSEWYQGSDSRGAGAYTEIGNGQQVRIIGRPVNMSYVDHQKFGAQPGTQSAINVPASIWAAINTALPGDGGAAVDPKYLDNGNIHVSKETELDLIFMDQQALYKNALAYYCYPTNNPPQSANDIKYPVVAFANAMVQKSDLSIAQSGDIASLYKGEGVKLKYVDQNGQMHEKFPAGTSVGWILYRNGYSSKIGTMMGNIPIYTIGEGLGANYSSAALTGGKFNTAVLRVGDFVVLGFDDGDAAATQRDYLDLVFHVKASVSDAITDPIPDVDPEPEDKVDYIEKTGVLAFEDLWPYQGDFDMNDVVVKYYSKVGINKKNEVINTEDKFTLLWCGAAFSNGFSYTVDGVSKDAAEVAFEGVVADSKVDATFADLTVHLFKNINKGQNNTDPSVTVKTKFKTPISKDQLKYAPYNTYITIDDKTNIGKETHLTNNKPINPEVAKWFGKGDDRSNPLEKLYFITFVETENGKQQLPFAIHMPGTGNPEKDITYVISQESKRIDNYYPKFINWINTKGTQDADWFLHPIK